MTTSETCIKPHESSAVNLLRQILLVYKTIPANVMNVFGYTSSHTVIAASNTYRFLPLFEKIENLENHTTNISITKCKECLVNVKIFVF
jgi:hypothetical protein